MYVVECSKLIAFCKVFQHHSPSSLIILHHLSIISHHSLSSLIILHHSLSFFLILQHSTLSYNIPYYISYFDIILPYSSYFDNILQHILSSDIIHHISPTFSIIRQIDIIFLQYFSTSFFFDNIRHHFTKSFFDKNFLSFTVK